MSTAPIKPGKLEDHALWREACDLVEFAYGKLADFPEDEKWYSASRLRGAAADLLFSIGQAAGSELPKGAEYEWGSARKAASALKTVYRFAGRQKFIELDPSVMVRLDGLIEQIDKQLEAAHKQRQAADKDELDHWHKKYALRRKMNHEN